VRSLHAPTCPRLTLLSSLSPSQVQLLLDAGADLHLVTNCHETPLHLAVREAHLAVTQLLVSRGADVHAKTRSGTTVVDEARSHMHSVGPRDEPREQQLVAAYVQAVSKERTIPAAALGLWTQPWPSLHLASASMGTTQPTFEDFAVVPAASPFSQAGS